MLPLRVPFVRTSVHLGRQRFHSAIVTNLMPKGPSVQCSKISRRYLKINHPNTLWPISANPSLRGECAREACSVFCAGHLKVSGAKQAGHVTRKHVAGSCSVRFTPLALSIPTLSLARSCLALSQMRLHLCACWRVFVRGSGWSSLTWQHAFGYGRLF